MSPVLEARGVEKRYRRGPETVHALRGVDLDVAAGELVGLAGPSGSGKTTLLNVVLGWEQADAGTVRWPGEAAAALPWAHVGVLPQRLGLADELTIAENVTLPQRLARSGPPGADDLLERLGLAGLADRVPAEVSLGEQQRAALARALVLSPRLVVADEPTGHQDEGWARVVLAELAAVCAAGSSCLVATHDPEALERVHRVVRLDDGALAR